MVAHYLSSGVLDLAVHIRYNQPECLICLLRSDTLDSGVDLGQPNPTCVKRIATLRADYGIRLINGWKDNLD